MSTFRNPPRYHTLLVTFWEERDEASNLRSVWRFRLEDPRTGWRLGFADLRNLVGALKQEVERVQQSA